MKYQEPIYTITHTQPDFPEERNCYKSNTLKPQDDWGLQQQPQEHNAKVESVKVKGEVVIWVADRLTTTVRHTEL